MNLLKLGERILAALEQQNSLLAKIASELELKRRSEAK